MEGSCFLEVKRELQDPLHRWMLFNVHWALQENGEHKTVRRSHSLARHCLSRWPEGHSVGMEKACLQGQNYSLGSGSVSLPTTSEGGGNRAVNKQSLALDNFLVPSTIKSQKPVETL